MGIFQWTDTQESTHLVTEPDVRSRVEEELADVVIYCLALANHLNLDISEAVSRKVELNVRKYPTDRYRGRY